jgi:hypothetical protein
MSRVRKKTKTFKQEEFIQCITNKNYDQFIVGDNILLDNALCDKFIVIGKDHDIEYKSNEYKSINIMPVTQVGALRFGDNNEYETSTIREWINNIYINYSGFSDDIINLMKYMPIYNAKTEHWFYDRAKLLSWQELGIINNGDMEDEKGIKYQYFNEGEWDDEDITRWFPEGKYGDKYVYWTRSRHLDKNTNRFPYRVVFNGFVNAFAQSCRLEGILPVLKF